MAYETEFITAGLTIIGGIIIFVFSNLIYDTIIKPTINLKEEIGKVIVAIVYYADLYTNPSNDKERNNINLETSNNLRLRASEIISKANAVPFFVFKITALPSKEELFEISRNLIGLSNSLWETDKESIKFIIEKRNKIAKLLKVKIER